MCDDAQKSVVAVLQGLTGTGRQRYTPSQIEKAHFHKCNGSTSPCNVKMQTAFFEQTVLHRNPEAEWSPVTTRCSGCAVLVGKIKGAPCFSNNRTLDSHNFVDALPSDVLFMRITVSKYTSDCKMLRQHFVSRSSFLLRMGQNVDGALAYGTCIT